LGERAGDGHRRRLSQGVRFVSAAGRTKDYSGDGNHI
jgi:hypothetical protein